MEMEFWVFLIVAIALIVAFPYIRCFFKRLGCLCKLKRICQKKSYKLHPTHPLWFLGLNRSAKCDLYIETQVEVFAIKLFGMPQRLSVLILQENGDYIVKRVSGVRFAHFTSYSKPKSMLAYDFRHQYQDAWEIKTPHNILLINPISMEIRRQSKNGVEGIVGAGEIVNGMEITSLSRLLGTLENAI